MVNWEDIKQNEELKTIFFWIPRVLGLIFTLFIYSFLIEVFFNRFDLMLFLYSVIPGTLFLISVLVAWFNELIGGWLILIESLVYFLFLLSYRELLSAFLMSLPLFLCGILFLIYEYVFKGKKKKRGLS